ncbi:hypothetical protein LguiA_029764 [Lonicera macranthoides]
MRTMVHSFSTQKLQTRITKELKLPIVVVGTLVEEENNFLYYTIKERWGIGFQI